MVLRSKVSSRLNSYFPTIKVISYLASRPRIFFAPNYFFWKEKIVSNFAFDIANWDLIKLNLWMRKIRRVSMRLSDKKLYVQIISLQ